MLPILITRNAVGPGDETTSQIRHAAPPSGQRAEAIQKILDALSRHLSGKEVLSRYALVRLMEDLARILKFPPLPQESGRDFVKRLIGFLQSMPMPERLLLERQLGGRSLAHRLAVLTAMPSGLGERTAPTGVVGANAGLPQSQPKEAIRNLPVQTAAPPQFAAIKASASSEVALLQSILKKTFGADEEGDPAEAMFEEAPDELPKDSRRPDAARTSDARTQRIPVSGRPDMETAASVAGGGMPGEIAETDAAPPPMQPEDEVRATGAGPASTGNFPGETEGFDASPSEPILPVPEDAEQTASDMEALLERGVAEAADADGLDTDGTYGRPTPDNDGHGTRPAGPRAEPGSQAARFSADAVKALVREGLALPEVFGDGGKSAEPKGGDTGEQMPAAPQESDAAEHSPLMRPRNEATGAAPLSDPKSDEPERTAALRSANQAKASNAGDDPAMQQMITRLVENGLPREAIPFALVPYPPAKADAEDGAGKPDQQEWTGDGESDAGADAESDEGDRETPAKESSDGGAEEKSDEPGAINAYDLYRKLGGLG
ncbi:MULTISPECIES: hypothetical protein [unclassified Sinorhizobium]|uniref:hypothetical protein n=1 Tax=unclassified Sinorhizobium TaxID=2613772 RepID=UPI0024C38B85|nr:MULTISPECIES: hypothetical protein [unclassified Sinorhizobium]MDK1377547.1 hypothetical protein [Sinorhizobium sp. 6-70]MDK1479254.1 hypothetical protein [Sinorhizobium sp. 6-117]